MRGLAAIVCVWALCVATAAGLLAHVQAQERDSLFERFQNRSETGSSFVGAYVADVFQAEGRLAAEVTNDGWRTSQFAPSLQLLGFPAAHCSIGMVG